jgi:hypothetical protein
LVTPLTVMMKKREELFETRDRSFNAIERGDQIPIRTLNLLLYSVSGSLGLPISVEAIWGGDAEQARQPLFEQVA